MNTRPTSSFSRLAGAVRSRRRPTWVALLLSLLPTGACSTVFYAPNIANAPLLRNDREVRMAWHVGGGDEVDYLVQGSVAGSVRPHLGLYGSGYLAGGSDARGGSRESGFGSAWDLGLGYHTHSARRFGLEAIGAFQYGHGRNTFEDAGRVTYQLFKPYAQLNLGYRGRIVEVAFAQRFGRIAYGGIKEDRPVFVPRPFVVGELIATGPSVLYEPSVSVRVGRDRLKIGFDLGFAHNASSTPLRHDRVAMGVGVYYALRP